MQGQRSRIAALYFPLVPLVLNHVERLDTGSESYISPMLNAASMASVKPHDNSRSLSMSDSITGSAPGSECLEVPGTRGPMGICGDGGTCLVTGGGVSYWGGGGMEGDLPRGWGLSRLGDLPRGLGVEKLPGGWG